MVPNSKEFGQAVDTFIEGRYLDKIGFDAEILVFRAAFPSAVVLRPWGSFGLTPKRSEKKQLSIGKGIDIIRFVAYD